MPEAKAIKTLSAPLRVFWELPPEKIGGPDVGIALGIAEELARLKIFFVTLRLSGPRADIAKLIAALKAGGVRLTISLVSPDAFSGWDALSGADAVEFFPSDVNGLRDIAARTGNIPEGTKISLAMVPAAGGAAEIIAMTDAGLKLGIGTFNLINPLVTSVSDAKRYILRESDRASLKEGLERLLVPFSDGVKLFVHDLFLHGALELPGLGGRIEYAGCQAGDAIAYIDGSCSVFPCASFPVNLGNMKQHSMKELWSGAARTELRRLIAALPAGCRDCTDAADCKGGCRGIAYVLGGHDAKDPACGR